MIGTLDSIWIAPIAGLPMVRVKKTWIVTTGLQWDREIALVSQKTGKRLVSSDPQWDILVRGFIVTLTGSLICITHKDSQSSFDFDLSSPDRGEMFGDVMLFGDSIPASVLPDMTRWFQGVLQDSDVVAVRRSEYPRAISRPRYRDIIQDAGFQHGCPISWHSRESELELASRLGIQLPVNVFRSNFIFRRDNPGPHWEDYLPRMFYLGRLPVLPIEAIRRCPTIDLLTGFSLSDELKKYRDRFCKGKPGPAFGMYGCIPNTSYILYEGAEITSD